MSQHVSTHGALRSTRKGSSTGRPRSPSRPQSRKAVVGRQSYSTSAPKPQTRYSGWSTEREVCHISDLENKLAAIAVEKDSLFEEKEQLKKELTTANRNLEHYLEINDGQHTLRNLYEKVDKLQTENEKQKRMLEKNADKLNEFSDLVDSLNNELKTYQNLETPASLGRQIKLLETEIRHGNIEHKHCARNAAVLREQLDEEKKAWEFAEKERANLAIELKKRISEMALLRRELNRNQAASEIQITEMKEKASGELFKKDTALAASEKLCNGLLEEKTVWEEKRVELENSLREAVAEANFYGRSRQQVGEFQAALQAAQQGGNNLPKELAKDLATPAEAVEAEGETLSTELYLLKRNFKNERAICEKLTNENSLLRSQLAGQSSEVARVTAELERLQVIHEFCGADKQTWRTRLNELQDLYNYFSANHARLQKESKQRDKRLLQTENELIKLKNEAELVKHAHAGCDKTIFYQQKFLRDSVNIKAKNNERKLLVQLKLEHSNLRGKYETLLAKVNSNRKVTKQQQQSLKEVHVLNDKVRALANTLAEEQCTKRALKKKNDLLEGYNEQLSKEVLDWKAQVLQLETEQKKSMLLHQRLEQTSNKNNEIIANERTAFSKEIDQLNHAQEVFLNQLELWKKEFFEMKFELRMKAIELEKLKETNRVLEKVNTSFGSKSEMYRRRLTQYTKERENMDAMAPPRDSLRDSRRSSSKQVTTTTTTALVAPTPKGGSAALSIISMKLGDKLTLAKGDIIALKSELATLNQQSLKTNQENEVLEKRKCVLEKDLERASYRSMRAEMENTALRTRYEHLASSITHANDDITFWKNKYEQVVLEHSSLAEDKAVWRQALEDHYQKYATCDLQIATLKGELELAKEVAQLNATESDKFSAENSQLEEELEKYKSLLREESAKYTALYEEHKSTKQSIEALSVRFQDELSGISDQKERETKMQTWGLTRKCLELRSELQHKAHTLKLLKASHSRLAGEIEVWSRVHKTVTEDHKRCYKSISQWESRTLNAEMRASTIAIELTDTKSQLSQLTLEHNKLKRKEEALNTQIKTLKEQETRVEQELRRCKSEKAHVITIHEGCKRVIDGLTQLLAPCDAMQRELITLKVIKSKQSSIIQHVKERLSHLHSDFGLQMMVQGDEFIVERIVPDGSAARAGVVKGDIILKINGEACRTNYAFQELKSNVKPGDQVFMNIKRAVDDERGEIEVALFVTVGATGHPVSQISNMLKLTQRRDEDFTLDLGDFSEALTHDQAVYKNRTGLTF